VLFHTLEGEVPRQLGGIEGFNFLDVQCCHARSKAGGREQRKIQISRTRHYAALFLKIFEALR
jgi:hypothetical protein